jgi:hypothetical protein
MSLPTQEDIDRWNSQQLNGNRGRPSNEIYLIAMIRGLSSEISTLRAACSLDATTEDQLFDKIAEIADDITMEVGTDEG